MKTDLRRELRLRDLVFFDVCALVSLRWVAAAAHAGPTSIVLWLVAAVFFLGPCAVTVARLSQRFPEEGGFYVWTKQAFGDRHAFLCGWFYFIANVLYFPSLILAGLGMTAVALGSEGERWAGQREVMLPLTLVVLWGAFAANFFGLRVAKWIAAVGGSSTFLIGGLLAVLALLAWSRSGSVTRFDLTPRFNFDTLNFWSQIAFAFVGLELAPLVSGEVRNPRRDLPRAALLAGALTVVFYIGMTCALLCLLPAAQISPMTGLAQMGVVAALRLKAPFVATCLALLFALALAGQLDTWIAGNTRLPYVIGLDRYLPAAFQRTHPRWGTPSVSLFWQAILATLFLLMAQLGDDVRAAYQTMVDMMVIVTFIPFLYIFGAGFRYANRLAAVSGLVVTLLAMVLSAIPPAEIGSAIGFEVKIFGGTMVFTAVGMMIFRRYERQRRID